MAAVLVASLLAACGRSDAPPPQAPTQGDVATAIRAIDGALHRGNTRSARLIAERLAERAPLDPEATSALARTLLASSLEVTGSDAAALRRRAIDAYATTATLAPKDPEPAHGAGLIAAMNDGGNEEAVRWFREAGRRNPTDARHPLFEGIALSTLGRVEEASQALERANTLNPDDATTLAALAEVCVRLDQPDRAIELAAAARQAAPDDPGIRLVEARVCRLAGRAERARSLLLALDTPTLASEPVARELSLALESLGEWTERAAALQRLAAAQPLRADVALSVAVAFADAGRPDEARYWLDRAESLGAPPSELTEGRERIRSATVPHPPEPSRP